jgi:hypothetical protein
MEVSELIASLSPCRSSVLRGTLRSRSLGGNSTSLIAMFQRHVILDWNPHFTSIIARTHTASHMRCHPRPIRTLSMTSLYQPIS